MKRILLLLLVLSACLCLFSCRAETPETPELPEEPETSMPMTEAEWRTLFALESVRVDCTLQQMNEDPQPACPHGGEYYLLCDELAAITNLTDYLIGEDGELTPVFKEIEYEDRASIVHIFDFSDHYNEFVLQEDGSYLAAVSSRKNIFWMGDSIKDVTVTLKDGHLDKVVYTYYYSSISPRQIYTYIFTQHGEVKLDPPPAE